MIPTEVYELARAIGKCGADEIPDDECIGIAWEIVGYLQASGYRIVPKASDARVAA